MAIQTKHLIKRIDEQNFHEIDYQITGLAFDIHNEIGRLWREPIYRNALAERCRKSGFTSVETEFPIIVSYQNFSKEYYVDLLIEDSIVYELKAVNALNPEHDKQTLHYLFLLGLQHGKLINFRTASVEKRFVSTAILPADRYEIIFNAENWFALDDDSIWLKEHIVGLLKDWGAFLETGLFYEATCHFRGGEDQVVKVIDVVHSGSKLGTQKVYLLNPDIAFKITAISNGLENYRQHLSRFIRLTNLKAIQWINLNRRFITFETIQNYRE